jgi:cytokinin trans-hydroxylase
MVKNANNTSYGNELLGLMLNATIEETTMKCGKVHFGMQTLLDNCKTFFIARQETSTSLPTWAKMLLASNTTWQEHVHEEVIEVCGHNDHPIDLDMFNKLKTIV